jgi:5-methylcytosine-specific restriction endonuclease McrA
MARKNTNTNLFGLPEKNPFGYPSPEKLFPNNSPFDYSGDTSSEKSNVSKLTPARAMKIRYLIGKCESATCKNGPSHVHHIKPREEGGPDTEGNLIVLCSIHHDTAHGKSPDGKITSRTTLKNYVSKRSKTKKDQVRAILKGKKN